MRAAGVVSGVGTSGWPGGILGVGARGSPRGASGVGASGCPVLVGRRVGSGHVAALVHALFKERLVWGVGGREVKEDRKKGRAHSSGEVRGGRRRTGRGKTTSGAGLCGIGFVEDRR